MRTLIFLSFLTLFSCSKTADVEPAFQSSEPIPIYDDDDLHGARTEAVALADRLYMRFKGEADCSTTRATKYVYQDTTQYYIPTSWKSKDGFKAFTVKSDGKEYAKIFDINKNAMIWRIEVNGTISEAKYVGRITKPIPLASNGNFLVKNLNTETPIDHFRFLNKVWIGQLFNPCYQ